MLQIYVISTLKVYFNICVSVWQIYIEYCM